MVTNPTINEYGVAEKPNSVESPKNNEDLEQPSNDANPVYFCVPFNILAFYNYF